MKILVTESQFKKLILKEQTTTLYKRGSKGEKVKEIQQFLKNNGYEI